MTMTTMAEDLLPSPEMLGFDNDPSETVAMYLDLVKDWLPETDHLTDVTEAKSRAEAIRIFILREGLGKAAELSATEIVRRAERRIAQLIRDGQSQGRISTRTNNRDPGLLTTTEASGIKNRSDLGPMYVLSDGISDEQFDAAIATQRAEGNLARIALIRCLKGEAPPERDEWNYRRRRVDANRVVREMGAVLHGLSQTVELVPIAAVPLSPETIEEWAASMQQSLKTLTRFTKEMCRGREQ